MTMDPNRWRRIQDIFQRALDLPPDVCETYLRDACAGDAELHNEVMALLRADREPNRLLDGRAIDAIGVPDAGLAAGSVVGSYRIIRRIGSGGMGAVYLAERADGQFEQRVALKVIKRGMDSAAVLARFQAERQILARLQHPNISRLTDGGVTADGLPFFTMEYVDGLPITRYCDEHRLSIEERLDLFQSVCAAVHYAHGNLVVHRDLKPGNILVTADGQVKLLDFGIARVIGEEDAGLTMSGQRVMTPAYASPEQVRGEPVTTASDVYSLGVVLYELLCGRHPHRDTASTAAELERAITEAPAERPSRFVTRIDHSSATAPPSLDDIASARRTAPARLRRRLEGDLDNICLMALRKEPERRYSSAVQLLDDIRRHLSGRPVSARADTVRYRAGKFVRRNATGVVVGAALVVVVAALTVVYTIKLEHERDRARLEAQKAAATSDFLSGLFKEADPYTSRGETITAREMLDRGRDRVHKELGAHPDVLADMLGTIGEAYGNLGVFDDAISSLKECLALRIRVAGERDTTTVLTMESLTEYLNEAGHYDEADSVGTRALAIARTLPSRRLLAASLGTEAVTQNYLGNYDEAEKLFREAIHTWQEVEGPNTKDGSTVMNDLALMLHEESRYAEADTLYRRALAIQEKAYGVRHPETATTRYNYAQLLGDMGHLSEADSLWEKVLANDRALYPQGHPAIAYSLSAYGRLLARIGEFGEAEKLQREALAIRRGYYGNDHPDVAYSLSSLGSVLHAEGKYDEAETLAREAYTLHARLGGEQLALVNLKNEIGLIQYDRGDYAAADTSFTHAMALQRRLAGDKEQNQVAVALIRHGAVLAALGRVAEGEKMARDGVDMQERLHADRGMGVATAQARLGFILLDAGKRAEADTLFTRSLAGMRGLEAGTPQRPRDIDPLVGLGVCRLRAGDAAGAGVRFREALDIAHRYLAADHPDVARCETGLGETLLAQGDRTAAARLLKHAVDTLAKDVLPAQRDLVEARHALAQCAAARTAGSP